MNPAIRAFLKTNRWAVLSIASMTLALVGWSVSSPAGSSPDDQYHLASIWCGQGYRDGLCERGESDAIVMVPAEIVTVSCFAFKPDVSASCQVPSDSGSSELQATNAFDQGFYPPVYYWSASFFASSDPYFSSHLIRILNLALYILLLSAAWLISAREVRRALALSHFLVIAPTGLFIIASTNPSAWAYAAVSTFWAILIAYFESTGRRRWLIGALLVVVTLIGAGARSDAAVWIILSTVVVLLYQRVTNWDKRVDIPVAAAGLAIVLGLSWGSSSQDGIATGGLEVARDVAPLNLFFGNIGEVVQIILGPLGSWPLGWLDTPMFSITSILATAIVVAVVFNFLVGHSRRENIALIVATAILVLAPLYLLAVTKSRVGENIQARYIFPWLAVVVGLIVLQARKVRTELSTGQAAVALLVLLMSHTYALHQNLKRYISGLDVGGMNLNHVEEWWWSDSSLLSPNIVWIGTTVAYGFAMFAMLTYYLKQDTIPDDAIALTAA